MTKNHRQFELSWLGYLGLLGFIGFLFQPLKILRLLCLLSLISLIPLIKRIFGSPTYLKYHTAVLIGFIFNPVFFWQNIVYSIGQFIVFLKFYRRLPQADNYQQRNVYLLPFSETWVVANGGVDKISSHSWEIINQRFAYDFVMIDTDELTHLNDGKRLDDYYCFNQPILAPCDGVIVAVKDKIPDSFIAKNGWIDWRTGDFRGNHMVIKHPDGEYSFLAHLKNGSIMVKKGDKVNQGQIIGFCGNSGHSTEPHLHFQVQNCSNFFFGVGLPVKFSNYNLENEAQIEYVASGYLTKNQKVCRSDNN